MSLRTFVQMFVFELVYVYNIYLYKLWFKQTKMCSQVINEVNCNLTNLWQLIKANRS